MALLRSFSFFSSLFRLSFILFLIFVLSSRIPSSIAFFFGGSGGCSCPICPPPPPPQSVCRCCDNTIGSGGGCGGGCGDGGSGGHANGGGYGSANCGGYNGGECAGGATTNDGGCGGTTGGSDGSGCTGQNNGCNDGNCGGQFGAGTAPTGGGAALPCPPQTSFACRQNLTPANCAPPNSVGCPTQSNGENCAMPSGECNGSGSVAEGSGCPQQQIGHTENCDGQFPLQSSAPHPPPSVPALSSNCQSIQICPPSHSSSAGNSLCQPICATNSPSGAQPSTGAGGTYANNGPSHPIPNSPPVMPPFPPESVGSPYESNNINNFASGPHPAEGHHQQNVGNVVDPSQFTTQQQSQIGPQAVAPLPVQPPLPAESDNQSDRESPTEGIGGGYRDTGLNNGGKEGGLSLLSSKLIKVDGQTTTTMKSSTMDWDLYEEQLPDLADYETATNIASGGASVGTKNKAKAFVPTVTAPAKSSTIGTTKAATFYTFSRTNSQRVVTPIVWAPQEKATTASSTTTTATTSRRTTTPQTTTTTVQEKNDLLSDDYSENSFKKVHASVQNRNGQKLGPFGSALSSSASPPSQNVPTAAAMEEDPKCSSETLRAIMQENIVLSPTISKQLIFSAGRLAFGQSIDVICSKNKFSYTVVSSKVFCEASNGPVTCFAFLQP